MKNTKFAAPPPRLRRKKSKPLTKREWVGRYKKAEILLAESAGDDEVF
jgi:hypothetical protein